MKLRRCAMSSLQEYCAPTVLTKSFWISLFYKYFAATRLASQDRTTEEVT